jgi:hypothetical protein
MQDSRPTLLWGIDPESGSIGALPASPLLLPALAVYCLIWLLSPLYRNRQKPTPTPSSFNEQQWAKNKQEYDALVRKIRAGKSLSDMEMIRLNTVLPRPDWAEPGEWWSY